MFLVPTYTDGTICGPLYYQDEQSNNIYVYAPDPAHDLRWISVQEAKFFFTDTAKGYVPETEIVTNNPMKAEVQMYLIPGQTVQIACIRNIDELESFNTVGDCTRSSLIEDVLEMGPQDFPPHTRHHLN